MRTMYMLSAVLSLSLALHCGQEPEQDQLPPYDPTPSPFNRQQQWFEATEQGNTYQLSRLSAPHAQTPALVDIDLHDEHNNMLTALHVAVLNACTKPNRTYVVQCLFEEGANPNERDIDGRTPFFEAAAQGNIELMRMLTNPAINYRNLVADINAPAGDQTNPITPLHYAAYAGNPQYATAEGRARMYSGIQWLLQQPGITVTHAMVESAYASVRPLLEAHLRERTAHASVAGSSAPPAPLLPQPAVRSRPSSACARTPKTSKAPLLDAIRKNQPEKVKELLAAGTDANVPLSGGITPLHMAASCGHAEIARALIAVKANLSTQTTGGATPLQLAIQRARASLVGVLLEAGADPNDSGKLGISPLDMAVKESKGCGKKRLIPMKTIIRHLLKSATLEITDATIGAADESMKPLLLKRKQQGAAIVTTPRLEEKDEEDNPDSANRLTELGQAAQKGDVARVKALLDDHDTDVNEPDEDGLTPLHRASQEEHAIIVGMLLAAGADVNAQDNENITPLRWAIMMAVNRGELRETAQQTIALLLQTPNIVVNDATIAEANEALAPLSSAQRVAALFHLLHEAHTAHTATPARALAAERAEHMQATSRLRRPAEQPTERPDLVAPKRVRSTPAAPVEQVTAPALQYTQPAQLGAAHANHITPVVAALDLLATVASEAHAAHTAQGPQ